MNRSSDKISVRDGIRIEKWRQQHAALGAPAYRVTLRGRRTWLRGGRNLGKGKGEGGSERFWTGGEVEAMIPGLARPNSNGFDVYITPISDQRYWLVLDDSNPDRLAELRRDCGWTPALVQETSKHDDGKANLQAIFIATQRPGDREAANALIAEVNQQYGDPNFTVAVHPFRLAGFANKKPGKGSPFTVIHETGTSASDPVLDRWLQERLAASPTPTPTPQPDPQPSPTVSYSVTTSGAAADASARWLYHAHERVHWDMRQGRKMDFSRVDYLAGRNMAREGWGREQIAAACLACSDAIRAAYGGQPLRDRHPDAERYADAKARDAVARVRGF